MAGAGYKLFNTGDVLTAAQVNTYLMEQTVMVFADAAARTAALSGVVSEGMISYLKDTNAVEVYNGSAWVASDDPNAIQNTIVDAKGDLISASAADTPARLAVGNNGETLVADSSTSTGLRWQTGANANYVINGGCDIWQRGTSWTSTSYTADRWYASITGTTTVSQETSDLPSAIGVRYGLKYVTSASSSYAQFYTALEQATVIPMRGQVFTASFYVKTAGSYAGNIVLNIDYSTSTDALTSQTTNVAGKSTSGSSATSWTRVQLTFTVPTDAVGLRIGIVPDTAQASGVTVRMTGVQLELGSIATQFKRAGNTLAGELAACQRYYWRVSPTANYAFYGYGLGSSTTNVAYAINYPTIMRVVPTSVDFANLGTYRPGAVTAITAMAIDAGTSTTQIAGINATTTGVTSGTFYQLAANNSTSSYLGLSAEL